MSDLIYRGNKCILIAIKDEEVATKMATSEAQKRAVQKYDAANTKQIHLKLNITTDGDILARLDEVADAEGGKQGYIKGLIRKDIAQNQG